MSVNYIDQIARKIGERCEMGLWDREERRLLRIYAVLALSKGPSTTLKDVHDAWSAWRLETRPEHPSIVPFHRLSEDIQSLDQKYRDAIAAVAAEGLST